MRFTDREIGGAIAVLRKRKGKTAAEVGCAALLVPTALLRAERGEVCLTAGQLSAVLEVLDADFLSLHCELQGTSVEEAVAVRTVVSSIVRRIEG